LSKLKFNAGQSVQLDQFLDHLVGDGEYRWRDSDAKYLRSLEMIIVGR
jgi:hypothetical protein